MKCETVSTYEDGCADQANEYLFDYAQTYCSLRTSFSLKEVLFILHKSNSRISQ